MGSEKWVGGEPFRKLLKIVLKSFIHIKKVSHAIAGNLKFCKKIFSHCSSVHTAQIKAEMQHTKINYTEYYTITLFLFDCFKVLLENKQHQLFAVYLMFKVI